DFSKPYDPKGVEDRIYKRWEASGYFAPEAHQPRAGNSNGKKTFSITMAPPNITGSLHMGHALEYTLSDILVRFKRMKGFKTLWLPGTDHAGIATQNVVEKELKKKGISRHQLGREKFLERVWAWKNKYGDIIIGQLKKLGVSADWSRLRFTMDDDYQKAVAEAFLHYHKKGWIYRGERVISWCPRCQTSLSDLELEYAEEKGNLWFIKYPLKKGGYISVATTRPETMLGDSAVAVNPKDVRYKNIIGQTAILPIKNRDIPIISDRRIEQEFGTGAVKITPAHDFLDAEIGKDNNLSVFKVIGETGKMTPEAGSICEGLNTEECRKKVVAELERAGLIEKIEEFTHNVAHCYRCNKTIEPIPSMQWFLKMDKLAKLAISAVKSGKIRFHPKRFEKTYFDWLKNIKDWTISRQIWWGHKIPIEGETDVLDTWFSSALWPFATLGWPKKTRDLKMFYPTDVLTNDRGIINLWDARMIFSGLEFMKKSPFRDLVVHATILTKEGKRMSKSLGTGIDPLGLIELYGADAVRFALIWQAMGGQDIRWSEEALIAGKKFLNKIWNASRFVLSQPPTAGRQLATKPRAKTAEDKKILASFKKITAETSWRVEKYEFGPALHVLHDFFWHDFCDVYIEAAKKQAEDENLRENTAIILISVLADSLKLLHPFIPHITEEIWSAMPGGKKNILMIEKWPK
ncbi:MAG: valine--tRNA ligase, partial [Patescibacteria group bacterium]